jgi:hypothetical protein
MNPIARWIGRKLADYLTRPVGEWSATTSDPLALTPGEPIRFVDYDWSLNDAK